MLLRSTSCGPCSLVCYAVKAAAEHARLVTREVPIYILTLQSRSCEVIFSVGATVEPSPILLRPFIGLLYQPWVICDDDCGAVDGMNDWQGKWNRRKPAPVPLCPPQTPHDLTRGSNPDRRSGKPATNCLRYTTGPGPVLN
jgi:hypothetical protein